jgi:dCTP deaminase
VTAIAGEELWARLRHPDEAKRLVVSPLLDPKDQVADRQSAIDVRLGRAFSLVRPWAEGVAEMLTHTTAMTSEPPLEQVVLDYGEPLTVHPHQFVLARTLEFVRLPHDLMAYVVGRSSWGRRGLIVATAVIVHPGFAGPITLEIKNVGEVPVALYPFDRIAQLSFHRAEGVPQVRRSRSKSQFASSFAPSLGTVRDKETAQRIWKLVKAKEGEVVDEADGDDAV